MCSIFVGEYYNPADFKSPNFNGVTRAICSCVWHRACILSKRCPRGQTHSEEIHENGKKDPEIWQEGQQSCSVDRPRAREAVMARLWLASGERGDERNLRGLPQAAAPHFF